MAETPSIERIIANTINEEARGDPDALAVRIVTALGEAGYRILPANGMKETARGSQPFDALTPEMRPQDTWGDGRDWTFETSEHGGDEPDNMPQAIKATDAAGHWAIYVPLTRADKIVVPRPHCETVSSKRPEMAPLYRSRFWRDEPPYKSGFAHLFANVNAKDYFEIFTRAHGRHLSAVRTAGRSAGW